VTKYLILALVAACLGGCSKPAPVQYSADADAQGHSAPTAATIAANRVVAAQLNLADQQDYKDATRGLIARQEPLVIAGPDDEPTWDMSSYAFITGAAPASVNPSLWRQAELNNIHGLFEVVPGIHQLRGFDLANLTLIDGDSGWIVVDPLTNRQTSAAAMAFAREQLGDKPVVAVIFTHSHVDHFGGILGVVTEEAVVDGSVQIIAPEGFLEEATSENVIAGTVMGRRSMFMYGSQLSRSPRGHVGSGLGKGPAYGSTGILAPTLIVHETPQAMTIDGVEFVFQNAPGSEAPAELTFYLPGKKAFSRIPGPISPRRH
jgi:alkyl sulfatase BDS1-like metallo-beta-lactamase superfamily hydrolase